MRTVHQFHMRVQLRSTLLDHRTKSTVSALDLDLNLSITKQFIQYFLSQYVTYFSQNSDFISTMVIFSISKPICDRKFVMMKRRYLSQNSNFCYEISRTKLVIYSIDQNTYGWANGQSKLWKQLRFLNNSCNTFLIKNIFFVFYMEIFIYMSLANIKKNQLILERDEIIDLEGQKSAIFDHQ